MSMRKSMALMSLMAGLMSLDSTGLHNPPKSFSPPSPIPKKEYKPLPENFGFNGIVPKGHKTETVDFDFEKDGYELSISIPITFGTMSSRAKQIRSLETQLKAHINRTPMNKLQEFNQFTITGELKKAPGGMSQFIPTKLGKGDYEGICNRTACTTNIPALYYNHSTREHYCRVCAQLINEANQADAIRLYGHELCTLV